MIRLINHMILHERQKFRLKFLGLTLAFFCVFLNSTRAQSTFPINGARDINSNYYAFTNATIFIDYKTKIDSATLLIRNGFVVKVSQQVSLPPNTVVYDLDGKYIYPSFIDIYTSYGMPELKRKSLSENKPQMDKASKGAWHWNEAIKPEFNSSTVFGINTREAQELRNVGFGAVLSHQKDGIARGTSVLVTLGDEKENGVMLNDQAAAHYSFNKGISNQDYPSSLMGSIALLRQTYYDAQWYGRNSHLINQSEFEYNISLDQFNKTQSLPQVFEADDYLTILRADHTGDEFGVQYIIKGAGDEYKRVKEIKKTKARLIIPINFPKPFDVEDPYDALAVSLAELKHWERAPANAAFLEKESIEFAITSSGTDIKKSFRANLEKAKKFGLNDSTLLKALTFQPASMIRAEEYLGALHEGMIANFLVTSDSIFNEKNKIYENWVQGKRYIINDYNLADVRGKYELNLESGKYELSVEGTTERPKGKLTIPPDSTKVNVNISVNDRLIAISFELKNNRDTGVYRLSGSISNDGSTWEGEAQKPDGSWVTFEASRKGNYSPIPDSVKIESVELTPISLPDQSYGFRQLPAGQPTLIKNTTVWTNEHEGVLKNADVLIYEGKITAVGQQINPEKYIPAGKPLLIDIVDGTGKHLTAGIIDEHSHIAISRGVNESGQASSAEVRVGDVINPDDINIYRQLAGGVTAAQLLHGSANPIGGQSALIKLKWGFPAEEMKIKSADGFIKFALGENVKQSNWGDNNLVRFPQTRMGVEQVFADAFTNAREYDSTWNKFSSQKKANKGKIIYPRKDLELEAIMEILQNKRFITCHSYIQSEINMLMHVADTWGFKVNTFTHILEGYKIADRIKKHGAGASSFSDWWAYKYEVKDAIPYNAAILMGQGVTVAINSDDAEMGRRLNQEAAKAVKYGNVSEEEALKLVTINPAKLLHLSHRMGSIKPGKDADLVLWSDHPLTLQARVEKTYVDGLLLYDLAKEIAIQEDIRKERARIITKMLMAKRTGEETQKPRKKEQKIFHCETLGE